MKRTGKGLIPRKLAKCFFKEIRGCITTLSFKLRIFKALLRKVNLTRTLYLSLDLVGANAKFYTMNADLLPIFKIDVDVDHDFQGLGWSTG